MEFLANYWYIFLILAALLTLIYPLSMCLSLELNDFAEIGLRCSICLFLSWAWVLMISHAMFMQLEMLKAITDLL